MTHEELSTYDPSDEPQVDAAFIELINLSIGMEAIPQADVGCFGCGAETDINLINYSYVHPVSGEATIEFSSKLPGFTCRSDECGVNYLDPQIDDRFLTAVGMGLARLGDTTLIDSLNSDPQSLAVSTSLLPANFSHQE